MNDLVQSLQKTATLIQSLRNSDNVLFEYLSTIPADDITDLINTYTYDAYGPVNTLRLDLLHKLKDGIRLSDEIIQDVQRRIEERDIEYFRKYGDVIITGMQNYPQKKSSMFRAWDNFKITFPFFYLPNYWEESKDNLETLAKELLRVLDISDYISHTVTFWGPQNFGTTFCWLALYPKKKVHHQHAYQLCLTIHGDVLQAGVIAGGRIGDKSSNDMQEFNTIDEVIERFGELHPQVDALNSSVINYWKYAPGRTAKYWDEFYEQGIMAIGWDDAGDLSQHTTETLAEYLGIEPSATSNDLGCLENFRDASIGDVIVANKGKSKAVGIGVIAGEYEYREDRSEFRHVRKVDWVINDEIEFPKTVFRMDTFSHTRKWPEIKAKYLELNPAYAAIFDQIEAGKIEKPIQVLDQPIREDINYWWLNANPKIWSIDSFTAGDIQTYTTHNERGNKRRVYKYFESVQPGDLVIGYESSPSKRIKAIFEITEALHEDENEGEIISFEILEIFKSPVTWTELKENRELAGCEVMINNQGSLFKLQPEEFEIIRDMIDEHSITHDIVTGSSDVVDYSFLSDPERPFIEENILNDIINALEAKKNIVLQGPPGVGKTFLARKIAYQMMGQTDDSRIEIVQFHQSYAYEDFIQGIRPAETSFKVKNGVFYNFCQKAEYDPGQDYFFIIDEINRGNLSKIFGELMMLIEADKRGKARIHLTYSEQDDAPFTVPPNLYLIGTMNTADRSLAIVDYALRRRFRFISLYPNFNSKFEVFLVDQGFSTVFIKDMIFKINRLNDVITADANLGAGFTIGHSFFCHPLNGLTEGAWLRDVVRYEIEPLLREYWFDDLERADEQAQRLLA